MMVLSRDIVGAETYLVEDVADAFVAEAWACERALIYAAERGFQRLQVEGDSLSVIKSIKMEGEDKSIIRPITQHICKMGLSFDEVTYLFVPRSMNGTAHTLALEGRRQQFCGRWGTGVPTSVKKIVMADRLAWFQRL
ncbi:hypothetical protein PVK06_042129 [Gossypium arboreum]|uniref:RNase H type-1 domain-containing protein n=1 Tax=Gossypium arboreum TaxID=29729 RepID=A0ABR0MMF0_GOSAR|nr:hypothetical protein PVK06_042129 [Gossypium arboreum]